ncbi:unnamed protein product [Allacma fusca]|uniref:Uncharacterized protein n=1 Tax=Allacma fusca TaxID=39272 RepID=A0A8J2P1K5_9HEXA|nr:unnamed protein product [Allacma fusca]
MSLSKGKQIKIAIVGDGFVGKTCLVGAYFQQEFLNTITPPTLFETYSKAVTIEGSEYILSILDTGSLTMDSGFAPAEGQFLGVDCVIICFALNKETTYHNVAAKWMSKVQELCPAAGIILVGTKLDLRASTPSAILQFQGVKLMHTIKASSYYECSAKLGIGIQEIFDHALRMVVSKSKQDAEPQGNMRGSIHVILATLVIVTLSKSACSATIEDSNNAVIVPRCRYPGEVSPVGSKEALPICPIYEVRPARNQGSSKGGRRVKRGLKNSIKKFVKKHGGKKEIGKKIGKKLIAGAVGIAIKRTFLG